MSISTTSPTSPTLPTLPTPPPSKLAGIQQQQEQNKKKKIPISAFVIQRLIIAGYLSGREGGEGGGGGGGGSDKILYPAPSDAVVEYFIMIIFHLGYVERSCEIIASGPILTLQSDPAGSRRIFTRLDSPPLPLPPPPPPPPPPQFIFIGVGRSGRGMGGGWQGRADVAADGINKCAGWQLMALRSPDPINC